MEQEHFTRNRKTAKGLQTGRTGARKLGRCGKMIPLPARGAFSYAVGIKMQETATGCLHEIVWATAWKALRRLYIKQNNDFI
jgi:hypothetical protein